MLHAADEPPADEPAPAPDGTGTPTPDGTVLDERVLTAAARNLRALIMAGERYRLSVAAMLDLGTTDSQALCYLAVHGARGQSQLARDLSLTSSAATALVDRLERHGAAERARHPTDRRRTIIRLTGRGEALVADAQAPLLASLRLVDPVDLPLVADWLAVLADDLSARTG